MKMKMGVGFYSFPSTRSTSFSENKQTNSDQRVQILLFLESNSDIIYSEKYA